MVWLKKNNPHYADIEIDVAEMETWEAPGHGVPSQIYACMERNEPSAWEKARTGQIVPPAERGLEGERSMTIEEVLAALQQGHDVANSPPAVQPQDESESEDGNEAGSEYDMDSIHEVTSTGMFSLDGPPNVSDAEKLQFACDAVAVRRGWRAVYPRLPRR